MAKTLDKDKAIKRHLAQVAKTEAFEALDSAVLQGFFSQEQAASWFDLILRCRSLEDVKAAKAIIDSVKITKRRWGV